MGKGREEAKKRRAEWQKKTEPVTSKPKAAPKPKPIPKPILPESFVEQQSPENKLLAAFNLSGPACEFVKEYARRVENGEFLGEEAIPNRPPHGVDVLDGFLHFLKNILINTDPEYEKVKDDPYLTRENYKHVLRLVLAGSQIAHEKLKNEGHPEVKNLHMLVSAPHQGMNLVIGGSYNIDMHHAIIMYGCFKRFARYTRLLKENAADTSKLQDICHRLIHMGAEEYYHAFQNTSPDLKQKLNKEFMRNYQASTAKEAMEKYAAEMYAVLRETAGNPDLRNTRMAALRNKNPFEIDADCFEDPIKEKLLATADHYLNTAILGQKISRN